jgi:hypothetical protein
MSASIVQIPSRLLAVPDSALALESKKLNAQRIALSECRVKLMTEVNRIDRLLLDTERRLDNLGGFSSPN